MPDKPDAATPRLTDEQLRSYARSVDYPDRCMATELLALRAALDALMGLVDDGLLVRNITNDDHWPSYMAEATRIVSVLSQVKAAREGT